MSSTYTGHSNKYKPLYIFRIQYCFTLNNTASPQSAIRWGFLLDINIFLTYWPGLYLILSGKHNQMQLFVCAEYKYYDSIV